jgi:hypothetical protein
MEQPLLNLYVRVRRSAWRGLICALRAARSGSR